MKDNDKWEAKDKDEKTEETTKEEELTPVYLEPNEGDTFERHMKGVTKATQAILRKHSMEKESFKRLMRWKTTLENVEDYEEAENNDELDMPIMNTHATLRLHTSSKETWNEMLKD